MSEDLSSSNKSRQYDFKFVIVLLAILAFLLNLTLSFPMSGSYGGVDNQWFVSPALFPLSILTALFICCAVLLISAVKQQGYQHFFSLQHWLGDKNNQVVLDRWLIIGLLIEYVYLLIPSTDFYLATTIFVISLISIFYLQLQHCRKVTLIANLLLSLCVLTIRLGLDEDSSSSFFTANAIDELILYCDICTGLCLLFFITWQLLSTAAVTKKKVLYSLIASIFVPLVLVMIFGFLLYVPMPVEYGNVISALNWLVYEQLGL